MINTRVPSNLLVSRVAIDISQKQNALANIQEQISSGKRINRPSDAPAESAHLLTMKETVARLDQYTKNTSIAESQLALEEAALAGTTAALNRVRDLAIRARSGQVNAEFRQEINSEVKLILDEVYTLANSRDSFGNYIFSGSNIHQQPFNPGDPNSYSGSDESKKMEIALGRTIDTGDSGTDAFLRIRNGNGDFKVGFSPANTGTGRIDWGAITDATLFQEREYEITFTSPNNFNVTDLSTGTVIQSGQPYTTDAVIDINGLTAKITGQPETGDTFQIEPSTYQGVFKTVSNLIDALDSTPLTPGETTQMRAGIDDAMGEIDNALNHINTVRARVGTRLDSIDNSRIENENVALQIERTKRDVEDVDITEAVTQLQMQANTLEIMQKSFARIEGLSLFNYL